MSQSHFVLFTGDGRDTDQLCAEFMEYIRSKKQQPQLPPPTEDEPE